MATALTDFIRQVASHLGPDPRSDGELLAAFLSRHEETAFTLLVRRHAAMVYGTCRRMLGASADVDDAFQASFVVLLRKAPDLTDRECVGSWLYGVAFHTALKARAMATKRRVKEAQAVRPTPPREPSDATEALDEELARLPEKYRGPVVLCELEGVPRKEAARRLGIAEGTISSRLATAHRMLERRLRARGVLPAALFTLSSQAVVVSDAVAAEALRAALAGPSTGVAALVGEVMKMMLLQKLKYGLALVAGVLLFLGGADVASRVTADERERPRAARAAAEPPAARPEKPAPDRGYDLAAGRALRLVGTPFPAAREALYQSLNENSDIPSERMLMVIATDGQVRKLAAVGSRQATQTPAGRWPNGWPLAQVLDLAVGVRRPYQTGDPAALATLVDADVLVRKGAATNDLLKSLVAELEARGLGKFTLEFRQFEREVVVMSGKHRLPVANEVRVEVFAEFQGEEPVFRGYRGTAQVPDLLGEFLECPVLDESDLKSFKGVVEVRFHERRPATPATRAVDRDPEKVLKNLAQQMGLTFRREKRPVRLLYVERHADAGQTGRERSGRAEESDPSWKADFRSAYGLKEGQLLRRVAPPYPACRQDYFRDLFKRQDQPAGQSGVFDSFNDWYAVIGWRGDWADPNLGQYSGPIKPDVGVPLGRLLDMVLRFSPMRVRSDAGIEMTRVTGDFVVRAGADIEKQAAALESVLRTEGKLPVKLSFKNVEEEVFVVSGKYTSKPLEGRAPNEVEVYAENLGDRKTGGGGSGSLADLVAHLERFVEKPVVLDPVQGEPGRVRWHDNTRSPFTQEEYQADRDPEKVLVNLTRQTGLTVAKEKRRIRVLVVEKAALKD